MSYRGCSEQPAARLLAQQASVLHLDLVLWLGCVVRSLDVYVDLASGEVSTRTYDNKLYVYI